MAKQKEFVCSDESVNIYDFRVLTDGIDTSQFERNPVMLYDHNENHLPIGRWEGLVKKDGQLLASPVFDEEDAFAAEIKRKVEKGIIRMASLGLRPPFEWSDDPVYKLPGQQGPTLVKSVLREISPTTFGGNLNALRLYDDDGNVINLNDYSQIKIEKTMDLKTISAALNLSDKASEGEVVMAITRLHDTNKQQTERITKLETENGALKEKMDNSEKEVILSEAVKEKRITAGEKAVFLKLTVEDIKVALADRKPAVDLSAIPAATGANTELEALKKLSWDELDKASKLVKLKEADIDAFKEKYKEAFGAEYKG